MRTVLRALFTLFPEVRKMLATRLVSRGVLAAFLLALTACLDASLPIESPSAAPVNFTFSNGPDVPGRSGVFRIEGRSSFFIVDAGSGLMSFHGLGVTIQEFCAGLRDPDVWDRQFVQVPSGALPALFVNDQHHVWIYPATPFDCAVLVNLPLLASGQTRIVRTDNDLTGFGGPGANSYGWNATGELTGADGGTLHYTEIVRSLIKPHVDPDSGEFEDLVISIKLR